MANVKYVKITHTGYKAYSKMPVFFTSKSLSKDFYNSLSAQKFLIEISDKTKGIDLELEGLSN